MERFLKEHQIKACFSSCRPRFLLLRYRPGELLTTPFTPSEYLQFIIRGEVLRIKNSEYIQACIVGGGSPFRVIMKHLLPNCVPILIITITLGIPNAILSEASLSYLGLGVSPPTASWGSMISEAQPFIRGYTYYSLFPGLAIIITVLSFNLLGDGLRDALDPKLRS